VLKYHTQNTPSLYFADVATPAQLEERSAGDLEVGDSIPGLSNLGFY
jgi:hypothetical protein